MIYLPVECFIIQRLQEGGWRVVHRRADLTDLPIADFVSLRDAEEWVNWKSGPPRINPYVAANEMSSQPRLIEIAIEPKSKADEEKLGIALAKLADEDPAFEFSIDQEPRQTVLKGVSELHLDAILETIRRSHDVDLRVGAPQVAFLERITRPAEVEYTYKKQSGGSGQFAAVKLRVEPNELGKGYWFESKIVGSAVPKEYIPGIEKGIESVLCAGVVAGFPVIDIKVELIDGKYHDIDSSALAFEIATRAAFREALQKAGPLLFEPIMTVEVAIPEDCIGPVIGDLNLRRGQIRGQKRRSATVISAMVPLIDMFGYANDLRSMSQGRATFTMQFDHYAPAPSPENDPPFRPAIGMRA
ncbi:translation elongation factor EF-G [Bradyrhizobium sp. S3.2.6]